MAKNVVKGLGQLDINIEKMNEAIATGENEGIIKSSEELLQKLKDNAPVRKGTLRDEMRLSEDVQRSGFTSRRKRVIRRISTGRAYHWWQVEFGNRFWGGNPFIRRTIAAHEARHIEIMAQHTRKAMKGAL